jgi:hypothetical protein
MDSITHIAPSVNDADDSIGERPGTRIRALLARTRPLTGNEVPDVYWEGRSLIEGLALAIDLGDDDYHWDAINCATVLQFLSAIEPTAGNCFCNDPSDINATCGFHVILNFMADEMRRLAAGPKIDVETMDTAINEQRGALFEAMGIVRLAARQAERGDAGRGLSLGEATDVWTALEGAHKLLSRIADRLESSETMLSAEVPRGEY